MAQNANPLSPTATSALIFKENCIYSQKEEREHAHLAGNLKELQVEQVITEWNVCVCVCPRACVCVNANAKSRGKRPPHKDTANAF